MFRRESRIFPVFIIILIIFLLVFALYFAHTPILQIANNIMKNEILTLINNTVLEYFEENKTEYDEIVIISRDKDEKISSVSVNFPYVNKIKAKLSLDILKNLSTETKNISIPLGNLFKNEFMWGMGPKIKFKIMPNPTVDINLRDDFCGLSINQTVHEIYLDVEANITATAPIVKSSAKVKTSFLLAHTVIVGSVPETYTGINEIPGSIEDYILDVTP